MIMSTRQDDPAAARLAVLVGDLRVVVGRLKRKLREQADVGDLSWSQISTLSRLEREGPATVTTLARGEGMRPQSMGAIIATLETAGLVTGMPDPDDGRQTLWSLTPACREWVAAGRAARTDWLARTIQAHLTAAEQEVLANAVALLKRLTET
jgi:DNA-binding MarR family transcriptional regulator